MSASVCRPFSPSKRYSFSTSSHGRSRRSLLSWSRSRVNSFSLARRFLRTASHSSCVTTLEVAIRSPYAASPVISTLPPPHRALCSERILVLAPAARLLRLRLRRPLEQHIEEGSDERIGRHHGVGVIDSPVLADERDVARVLAK